MKTKWIQILLCCLLLISGCVSPQKDKEDVMAVMDGYYGLLMEGNVYKACQRYASDSFEPKDEIIAPDTSDTFAEDAEAYMEYVFSKMFQEYEVLSIEIQQDTALVKVRVDGIDPQELSNQEEAINAQIEMLWDSYFEEHKTKLTQMIIADEEKASEYVLNELTPKMFACYKNFVDALPIHSFEVNFTLEKKESVWKIIEMK